MFQLQEPKKKKQENHFQMRIAPWVENRSQVRKKSLVSNIKSIVARCPKQHSQWLLLLSEGSPLVISAAHTRLPCVPVHVLFALPNMRISCSFYGWITVPSLWYNGVEYSTIGRASESACQRHGRPPSRQSTTSACL